MAHVHHLSIKLKLWLWLVRILRWCFKRAGTMSMAPALPRCRLCWYSFYIWRRRVEYCQDQTQICACQSCHEVVGRLFNAKRCFQHSLAWLEKKCEADSVQIVLLVQRSKIPNQKEATRQFLNSSVADRHRALHFMSYWDNRILLCCSQGSHSFFLKCFQCVWPFKAWLDMKTLMN